MLAYKSSRITGKSFKALTTLAQIPIETQRNTGASVSPLITNDILITIYLDNKHDYR